MRLQKQANLALLAEEQARRSAEEANLKRLQEEERGSREGLEEAEPLRSEVMRPQTLRFNATFIFCREYLTRGSGSCGSLTV